MNSYNENLNSSVSSSLNNQEVVLKKAESQLDATMFSLYYAQGAFITDYEKLEVENNKYKLKQKIYNDMVVDSDLSTNVLLSAKQSKEYVSSSISNTAVAASNVQIASNAILKLASDIGSIFSIVNAADFDSEIYQKSKDANDLMNDTAYLAEVLSDHGMKTSSLVAEVSADQLTEKATDSNADVKSLLQVLKTDFEAISALVKSSNDALAKASVNEKNIEGSLEDIKVSCTSKKRAYKLTNEELNLNLKAKQVSNETGEIKYNISFFPYKSAFELKNPPIGYPVDTYYIFVVKESKKKIFSISEAEAIITEGSTKQYKTYSPNETKNEIIETFMYSDLNDSDNDKLKLGENYVAFVLVAFDSKYKKLINNFDDYITAPSAVFTLTNYLNAPEPKTIEIKPVNDKDKGTEEEVSLADKIISGKSVVASDFVQNDESKRLVVDQKLTFSVEQNPEIKVEYRCMFLPHNAEIINGLLTNNELNSIEEETEALEKISNKYDPLIVDIESKINTWQIELEETEVEKSDIKEVSNWLKSLKKSLQSKKTQTLEEIKKLSGKGEGSLEEILKKLGIKNISKIVSGNSLLKVIVLHIEITLAELVLKQVIKKKEEALKNASSKSKKLQPGFLFNRTIAEKVPAGSYSIAKLVPLSESTNKADKNEQDFEVVFKPETTDNFGNRLIPENKYIPVILALSNQEGINNQFTNNLSDYTLTAEFTYKVQKGD